MNPLSHPSPENPPEPQSLVCKTVCDGLDCSAKRLKLPAITFSRWNGEGNPPNRETRSIMEVIDIPIVSWRYLRWKKAIKGTK